MALPVGLAIGGVVLGAVVIAAFVSGPLWGLARFFPAGGDLEQNRPGLTAIARLPPVTQTSVIVAPVAMYGSTRSQLLRTCGSFGVGVEIGDNTDRGAVAAALHAAPTSVLDAETIAHPTTYPADHPALTDPARRHGAAAVRGKPAGSADARDPR